MLYKLTKEELLRKLPIAKLLCTKKVANNNYTSTIVKLKRIQYNYKRGYIPLQTAQLSIDTEILKVRELYPEDFYTDNTQPEKYYINKDIVIPKKLRNIELDIIIKELTSTEQLSYTLKEINTCAKQLEYTLFTIYELTKIDTRVKRTVKGYKFEL